MFNYIILMISFLLIAIGMDAKGHKSVRHEVNEVVYMNVIQ